MQLLAARVMAPVLSASQAYAQYQEADVGIAHLADILNAPVERSTGVPPLQRLGSAGLEAKGLTLSYPGNLVPALNDVTFAFPARGLFAIVGRNGSGKSSLVRTFLGLQRDFQGTARVAGHDVLDYAPRWLRRQFGIVNQDSALFIGTVRENVSSGLDRDDARVWRALDASGARRFVEALPDGLDTIIQEGARNLSGGQRQRLIVARALYRDPPFLILDEPTAFLDPEAALALERNLAALGKDRLVLMVTHHLTATMDADRILVMDEGRVVGEGAHEDLLTSCPTYTTLWDDYHRSNRDGLHSLSLSPQAAGVSHLASTSP
jgi:ABC-type multidrug transport system fused ATPase/permease subunit